VQIAIKMDFSEIIRHLGRTLKSLSPKGERDLGIGVQLKKIKS
jgi:hypothetical protein